MDSKVAVQGCLPSGVVTFEEALRLMKITPKNIERRNAVADREPIYNEDVEKLRDKETKEYVAMALDHYNATTEGPKYELVEAIGVVSIVHIGLWYHVCFTAKPISTDTDSDTDASPKHFFAEIAYHLGNTVSCTIVDLNSPDTIDGCGSCAPNGKMYHPRGGFQVGDWPYYETAELSVPEWYYDASVPMERRIKVDYDVSVSLLAGVEGGRFGCQDPVFCPKTPQNDLRSLHSRALWQNIEILQLLK